MPVAAKICGLSDPVSVDAALENGARMLGFVFFPKSPRHVTAAQAAALGRRAPADVARVGVLVDPDGALLDDVAAAGLDMLQLHGAESPARVADVKARFGLPVIKALPVREAADLAAVKDYENSADWLLFDAKAPKHMAALPGGNGLSFDWDLLKGLKTARPWLLSGGLDAGNVAEAVARTKARWVDVSSGVERAPGVKDPAKIAAFLAACKEV